MDSGQGRAGIQARTSEPGERSTRPPETPVEWHWVDRFPRPERGFSPHLKVHLWFKEHTQNTLGRLRPPISVGTKLTVNVDVLEKNS